MGWQYIDDDRVGNYELLGNQELLGEDYMGESLRGLQSLMGAARPPARRPAGGALGALQQARLARHQPMQHRLAPAYKDSTQFGVECNGTFAATSWAAGNTNLPTVTGRTRMYESFKPGKVITDEQLIITFSSTSLGDTSVAVDVADAGDLKLIGVFAGAKNCFPTAPDQTTGVSGRSLSNNSLGNGVSWPTINGGIDLVITFAVRRTAVFRATPPSGYTSADISTVEVLATLNLFGESLRP